MKNSICKNTGTIGSNGGDVFFFLFFFTQGGKELDVQYWQNWQEGPDNYKFVTGSILQGSLSFFLTQKLTRLSNFIRQPGEFLSLFISLGCWLRCCCGCFDLQYGLSVLRFVSCHLISHHYIDWPLSTPNCDWLTVSLSVGSSGWTH